MSTHDQRTRLTTGPGDVKVIPPEDAQPESDAKFYMGTKDGKAPTEEEALAAGRALFDAITAHQARTARR